MAKFGYCPNLSSPVTKAEFEELTNAVGPQLNYFLWDANKGHHLDKTSTGKPSEEFNKILSKVDGNRLQAIRIISKKFGDGFQGNLFTPEGELVSPSEKALNKRVDNAYNILRKQNLIHKYTKKDPFGNPIGEAWAITKGKDAIYGIRDNYTVTLKRNYKRLQDFNDYYMSRWGVQPLKFEEKPRSIEVSIDKEALGQTPEPTGKFNFKDFIKRQNKINEANRKSNDHNRENNFYQNNTDRPDEQFVASEKTIRDLAERIANRIGLKVRYESDRTKDYKGKLEGNTAVINLTYATLDTPIHEILGHPIISAIKNKSKYLTKNKSGDSWIVVPKGVNYNADFNEYKAFDTESKADDYIKDNNFKTLYNNLLKELEYGKGKEVLDKIKRDYPIQTQEEADSRTIEKLQQIALGSKPIKLLNKRLSEHNTWILTVLREDGTEFDWIIGRDRFNIEFERNVDNQQEEAIVELLGLYAADRLDKVKDGKLISLLKRLLKEMKDYMKKLFKQREVEINKLPDNMTLGDLADVLAYSNSKLILPGNEVKYTTPDNQTFKTYKEASDHISELTKLGKVDLSNIKLNLNKTKSYWVRNGENGDVEISGLTEEEARKKVENYNKNLDEYTAPYFYEESKSKKESSNQILNFISKNKEYEQSREIIDEWKKINNIKYDPEEVYSRGQGFYSVVGAYSNFDVELMFQNLLAHIEDNKKAGGEFTISAFTKPINKKIRHLEGGGGKIKFKIFPKSEDIKWASNTDVHSGSVWDASEKVSKNTKSELIGVSYTKSPKLENLDTIQPNLAYIIDNLAYHYNELGIELTGNNFRLEYDNNIPYSTKKLIDRINNILDQKFGKIVEPKISTSKYNITEGPFEVSIFDKKTGDTVATFDNMEEANKWLDKHDSRIKPKQPTKTKENTTVITDVTMYDTNFKEKDYFSQANINTKIAALKQGQRKYPRSLIRSEVVDQKVDTINDLFEGDEDLPFQKVPSTTNVFSLETSQHTPNIEELDNKLISVLGKLGISVEEYNDFKSTYGADAVAVADLVNKLVRYSKGKLGEETLAEETFHFLTTAYKNQSLVKRLSNLIEKNDYYKEVLGDEFNQYNELYNGNKDMLVKEAIDKLLAKAYVANFKEANMDIPAPHMSLIQRFWNYIKGLFSKVPNSSLEDLIKIQYGKAAQDIINADSEQFDTNNLVGNYFELPKGEFSDLKALLKSIRNNTAERIDIYERRGLSKLASKERELLVNLSRNYSKGQYLEGAIDVAQHISNTFKTLDVRHKQIQEELSNPNSINLRNAAKTLRDMKEFIDSYEPLLKHLDANLYRLVKEYKGGDKITPKDIEDVLGIIGNMKRELDDLSEDYYKLSLPIFSKFLKPFIGAGPLANIEKALKEADADVSFWSVWIDAMADSDNDILQLIDIAVKDAKEDARFATIEMQKNLIKFKLDLEKAGIKNTDWMFEKDRDGKMTGYFISDILQGEFEKTRSKFFSELNKQFNLPEDFEEREAKLDGDPKLKKAYNKEVAKWYDVNMEPLPIDEINQIIEEQKEILTPSEFATWQSKVMYEYNGETKFKGELSRPARSRFSNPVFQSMNDAQRKYYNAVMEAKKKLDLQLPSTYRNQYLAPQIRKDFIERLKEANTKSKLKQIKEEFKDTFSITEDETAYGNDFRMAANNMPVDLLPIYFTKRLEDPETNLSTDVTNSMVSYAMMANDYYSMSKIVDMLEIGRDLITDKMRVKETTHRGEPVVKGIKIFNKVIPISVYKDPNTTNIVKRLNEYYDMVVYGRQKVKGKKVLGAVDSEKLIDFLSKYTAINNLALNVYAGIQNPLVGRAMMRMEAFAKQFVDSKDFAKAEQIYWAHLPKTLSQMGSRNQTNKLQLWIEYFNTLQDYSENVRELNMERKNWVSRMFKGNTLFFMNNIGEHYLQTKMSLALANKIKLKDSKGNSINLWDAYEVRGNKLTLKDGITKEDGSAWTQADLKQFIRRQHGINKSLHGIYNDIDKSAVQKFALGRMVMMFRKFMRPGYLRRFRKERYSYEMQAEQEGFHRTFARLLLNDIRNTQTRLIRDWSKLSDLEKANVFRSITEISLAIGAVILASIIGSLGWDDDDDWYLNMIAYQSNRFITEIGFFISPNQTLQILQSPAAGVDQLTKLSNLVGTLIKPWNWGDRIQSGKYKGYTRLARTAIEDIPLYTTVSDIFTPQDKLVFFKLANQK
jgi:hypothetical protein